jgi:hypothetical protein
VICSTGLIGILQFLRKRDQALQQARLVQIAASAVIVNQSQDAMI